MPTRLTLDELRKISQVRAGFTGTSSPLTPAQEAKILSHLLKISRRLVLLDKNFVVVTGGAFGVDAFIAQAMHEAGFHVHTVLPASHSHIDPLWEYHCKSFMQMPDNTTYMDRNDELVLRSTFMGGAFPDREEHPQGRRDGGTWATVRRFRRAGMVGNRGIVRLDLL